MSLAPWRSLTHRDTWEMGSLDVESSLSALQVDPPEAPSGGGHIYGMPTEVEIFRMNLHQSHDESMILFS